MINKSTECDKCNNPAHTELITQELNNKLVVCLDHHKEIIDLENKLKTWKSSDEQEKQKMMDTLMYMMVPSMSKLKKLEDDFKKTGAYAWDQLQKMEKHIKDNPKWESKTKHCSEPECSDLTSRDKTQGYIDILMKDLMGNLYD